MVVAVCASMLAFAAVGVAIRMATRVVRHSSKTPVLNFMNVIIVITMLNHDTFSGLFWVLVLMTG